MISASLAPVLALLLTQSGWALAQAKPREVGRTYWELVPEMEIWVRLVPEDPAGKPPLVNLVLHAFFPGRAERDPYTGLPAWPKGEPARLTISAEPLASTVARELKLSLVIDGRTMDLTRPGSSYRELYCLGNTEPGGCSPTAVEADLDAATVRSLVDARQVTGSALGFPVKLAVADQMAVCEFATKAGLYANRPPVRYTARPGTRPGAAAAVDEGAAAEARRERGPHLVWPK